MIKLIKSDVGERARKGGEGVVSDVLFELPLAFLFLEKELKYCTITYIEKINSL